MKNKFVQPNYIDLVCFILFLDYCNKTFYQKSNLRLHMMIHENIKPYECSYCDKRFTQKATRDIHLTKHTGFYT